VLSSGTATLRTDNVFRISLSEPEISPVLWHERHVTIDDVNVNVDFPLGMSFVFLPSEQKTFLTLYQREREQIPLLAGYYVSW